VNQTETETAVFCYLRASSSSLFSSIPSVAVDRDVLIVVQHW